MYAKKYLIIDRLKPFLFIILQSGLLASSATLYAQAPCLSFNQGSSSYLDVTGGVSKIIISDPNIIDVRPQENGESVLVKCLNPGMSELRISQLKGADLIYKILVNYDLKDLLPQIKELLSDVEGIENKIVGNRIVLDGCLFTKTSYDKVIKVAAAYPNLILNLTKLDRTELNHFVEEALTKEIGMESLHLRVQGDTAILEGTAYDKSEIDRAIAIIQMKVPQVINLVNLEEALIETDACFIQIDDIKGLSFGDNVLKNFGVDAKYKIDGVGRKAECSYNVNAAATLRLNALVGMGVAKIIAQPHLCTRSGESGTFHSGGESYFEVSGVNFADLKKVDYGVFLTAKPTLQGRKRIVNQISIEVSVPAAQDKATFALDKFTTSSSVLCNEGESILVSGLDQSLENHFKEKTPLLGDIPLLSLFFKQRVLSKNKRELLVMITPRPVFPADARGATYGEQRKQLLQNKTNIE